MLRRHADFGRPHRGAFRPRQESFPLWPPSEQDAADKLAVLNASLKQLKLPAKQVTVSGIQSNRISVPGGRTLYLAQAGKQILLATDPLSLADAAAAASGAQPGLAESADLQGNHRGTGEREHSQRLCQSRAGPGARVPDGWFGPGAGAFLWLDLRSAWRTCRGWARASATMATRWISRCSFEPNRESAASIGPVIACTAVGSRGGVPVFAKAREAARSTACESNLTGLATATLGYAEVHGGRLPMSGKWRTSSGITRRSRFPN